MSFVRFSARLDTSHHGPPYPSKDAEVDYAVRILLCPLVLVMNIDDVICTETFLVCKEH
jgi:hypothetical protein